MVLTSGSVTCLSVHERQEAVLESLALQVEPIAGECATSLASRLAERNGEPRLPKAPKLFALIIGLDGNPSLTTRAQNIEPMVQMNFDLAQYLHGIFIRIPLPCHLSSFRSLKNSGTVLGG